MKNQSVGLILNPQKCNFVDFYLDLHVFYIKGSAAMEDVPRMRTGFDLTASTTSTVPVEKRAMMMCIHNFLVAEGTAVYHLYRLLRYDMHGKEVDEATELDLLRKSMRYIVLCGVGGELEQVLYAVIHDTDVEDEALIEKYAAIINHYPQVLAKMVAGEPKGAIIEWLANQTNQDMSFDDSDDHIDDSDNGNADDHESVEDILMGVDQANDQWSHFGPATPIQTIVKDALDRM